MTNTEDRMTNATLDAALTALLIASGIPGLRVTPRALARHFGCTPEEARRALRRATRRGDVVGGRTV